MTRTLTSVRPYLPAVRLASGPLGQWTFFAAAVAVAAFATWGRVRTGGVVGMAVAVAAMAVLRFISPGVAAGRLVVLLLALTAAYLAKPLADPVHAHRFYRWSVGAGLGLLAVLSIPRGLVAAFNGISPGGGRAWAAGLLGIALPFALLQTGTTPFVWTGDTMPVIPTVAQMYRHGTRDLTPYQTPGVRERWDVCGPDRPYFVRESPTRPGVYSTYPAGMEAFAWPAVVIADLLGADIEAGAVQATLEKQTAGVVAGLTLALVFLIGLRVGTPVGAFATAWLLATGSVFFTTVGMLLWQQGGILFWTALAVLVELGANGRPGWKGLLIQAVACGWVVACRPSAVTFVVPFGLWVLLRDWRRGLLLPMLSAVAFLPWAAMYWTIYRQPFGPAMGFLNERWFFAENVGPVIWSPSRGLLVYQPWMLLLPLLLVPAVRRGPELPRGFWWFAAASAGLHLLLVGSWPCWWGGSCYGSRLAAEVVLLAAVAAVRPVGWLLTTRGWPAVALVGVMGLAVHLPCAYNDAWNWNAMPIPADSHPDRLHDWGDLPFLFHG